MAERQPSQPTPRSPTHGVPNALPSETNQDVSNPNLVSLNPSSVPPNVWRNPSPSGGQVSFASVVAAKSRPSPRFPTIVLPARQYGSQNGKPFISFTSQEFEAGAKLFQFSLIAKFTFGRPRISEIRDVLKSQWDIKGRATLSEIWDARHIMIILDSEADVCAALTSPIRKIGHALFQLFRYTVDYNPKRESTITTKWIRLPGLPPPLFNKNFIGAIANSIGHFLDIDDQTKVCSSLKYARFCVELDVTEAIPS